MDGERGFSMLMMNMMWYRVKLANDVTFKRYVFADCDGI